GSLLSYVCSLPWQFIICKLSVKKFYAHIDKQRWSTSSFHLQVWGGSAPSLHTGAGSLPVHFTRPNTYTCSQEYYCCRGPVVASTRSSICSSVTATLQPLAYLTRS